MVRRPPHLAPGATRPAAERHAARGPRVGPIGAIRQPYTPAWDRVEMGGQAPAGSVPYGVRPHDAHRDAVAVNHDEPETRDCQHPLQELERHPAGRLRPCDRRRAHEHGARHLPLAEVGHAAGAAHDPGDVQAIGHVGSLTRGAAEPEARTRDLWTRPPDVDNARRGDNSARAEPRLRLCVIGRCTDVPPRFGTTSGGGPPGSLRLCTLRRSRDVRGSREDLPWAASRPGCDGAYQLVRGVVTRSTPPGTIGQRCPFARESFRRNR
jgi:hypothetical protein